MSTLHIEHPISDLTIWKAAFDRFAPVRQQSGVRSHRIQRPVNDPCSLGCIHLERSDSSSCPTTS
jgi:hypothetical protein